MTLFEDRRTFLRSFRDSLLWIEFNLRPQLWIPPSTGGLPSDKIINTTKFDCDNHRKVWLQFVSTVAPITLLPFLPYVFVVNRVTKKLQSFNFKAGVFKESKAGKCGNWGVWKITNWNGWKVRSSETWKFGYLGIRRFGNLSIWKYEALET